MKKQFNFLLFTFLFVHAAIAQYSFSSADIRERLKRDIIKLSSEEFKGREAGTEGERLAAEYIQQLMQQVNLKPVFNGSYLQEFEFNGDMNYGDNILLSMGDQKFSHNNDFFVLPNSATATVSAPAVYAGYGLSDASHDDYAAAGDVTGKILFMEYYLPETSGDSGTNILLSVLQKKVATAVEKGAAAIIFINTSAGRNDPNVSLNQQLGREDIPVLFARARVYQYWQELPAGTVIELSAELKRETLTGYNVAGYLDNGAATTVVIGGHYDHLGYGGRSSRNPGVHALHPGADDNASGTAGVIEVARYLAQSDLDNHNYLFIAFSAEEKGLLGSRYFTESKAYDMSRINYMFNFDMLGRVENNNITLIGTGTSPVWDTLIDKSVNTTLVVRKSPGGVGGSDHSNFYRLNIPVIFFFSGLHEDYHRPSDTEDKINYEGMELVLRYSLDMIARLDGAEKLPFTATAVAAREGSRMQGPTLGLMPDHAYNGVGLRIQAVTNNRPAHKAGMAGGDVIIRIGETRVSDIQTYMQALSTLKANELVKVKIIRDGKEMDIDVTL